MARDLHLLGIGGTGKQLMEQFKLLSACAFGSLIVSDPKLFEDISTWRDSTSRYRGGGVGRLFSLLSGVY
jgi:hypothetical protein